MMNKRAFVVTFLIFHSLAFSAAVLANDFRIFTAADDKVVEAKMLDFDLRKGVVLLEKSDGKKVWVRPSVFTDKDQSYIEQWIKLNFFLSNEFLFVTVKKDEKAGESIQYEVEFENRSDVTFENLLVTYRVYIEVNGYGNYKDGDRYVDGTFSLESLGQKERMSCSTKAERIGKKSKTVYKPNSGTNSSGEDVTVTRSREEFISNEHVAGLWLRISDKNSQNQETVREICWPTSLSNKYEWNNTMLRATFDEKGVSEKGVTSD